MNKACYMVEQRKQIMQMGSCLTSAGSLRSQYTSLKYISPPGASTRYTSRSTRALSGDRLICGAVEKGRKSHQP